MSLSASSLSSHSLCAPAELNDSVVADGVVRMLMLARISFVSGPGAGSAVDPLEVERVYYEADIPTCSYSIES